MKYDQTKSEKIYHQNTTTYTKVFTRKTVKLVSFIVFLYVIGIFSEAGLQMSLDVFDVKQKLLDSQTEDIGSNVYLSHFI